MEKNDFTLSTPGREIVRLNADGSYRIAPNVTDEEMRKVFGHLVEYASGLNKKVRECERQHQS